MQPRIAVGILVSLALSGTACQPDTITEARDQLGRGGTRTFSLSVPITSDTLTIARFLDPEDTATTRAGLLGVPVDSKSVTLAVGEELRFSGLNFDAFSFGYDQMLTTSEESVTVSLAAPAPPARSVPFQAPPANGVGFKTDNGSGVQSATIGTGWFVREVVNGTACSGLVSVTATDALGNDVATFPDLPVMPDSMEVDSVNAAGSSMEEFVEINATATPTSFCPPGSGGTVSVKVFFRPMTLASVTLVNVTEPFSSSYGALASESRVQAVDTIVANSGTFTVTAENRLPIDLAFDIELAGIFRNGANETASFVVAAAPGDGSTTTGSVDFDLAGDTIVPSQVMATVNGNVTAAVATITNALVSNAVVVNATGDITVQTLIGSLDPAQTPELVVGVKDFAQISAADFGFGDFEEAIRDATIRSTDAYLTVVNTSGIPLRLDGFILSVARIDPATGEPFVDASGDFILETDALGAPLQVLVADSGSTSLAIPRAGTANVILELAPVANRIVNLAIDDIAVAMVATGNATAGDASPSRIERSDMIEFAIKLVVGVDLSLPFTGISFQVNDVESGGEFSDRDADDLARHVVSAGMNSVVENGTPFALKVEVAYVEGDRGLDFDAFSAPDRIELDPVEVDAPVVGPFGRTQVPVETSAELVLTGDQIRQLLGTFISSSIRITLLPGTGGGGRAAVRPTDEVQLGVRATLEIEGGRP